MIGKKKPHVLYRGTNHHIIKIDDHNAFSRPFKYIPPMTVPMYTSLLTIAKKRKYFIIYGKTDCFELIMKAFWYKTTVQQQIDIFQCRIFISKKIITKCSYYEEIELQLG